MTLLVKETYINETRGYRFGDSDWFEPFTDDRGKLFRSMQREYGRCVSKVYVDTKDGEVRPVGWVFQKRERYDDAGRDDNGRYPESAYFVREVWVTLRDTPPVYPVRQGRIGPSRVRPGGSGMSKAYRMEREAMPPGSTTQLFRVIVRLGRGWGTVQAGLPKPDAETLLDQLLENEAAKQWQRVSYRGGIRR